MKKYRQVSPRPDEVGGLHAPRGGSRTWRRTATAAALALVAVVLAACAQNVPVPRRPPAAETSSDLAARLNPQPPVLPNGGGFVRPMGEARVLPGEPVLRLRPMAVGDVEVDLRVLVVTASRQDPAFDAWRALLDQTGTPYDVLVASEEDLTEDKLIGEDGVGRYHAVLLATNSLAMDQNGQWLSQFTASEWDLLFDYERTYGVRQVAFYSYPGTEPESYGALPLEGRFLDGYEVHATPEGEQVFTSLAAGARIELNGTYGYPSQVVMPQTTVPLLVDDLGNVFGVFSVAPDGRERIALFYDNAAWGGIPTVFTQVLGADLVRWATQGLYIGERRHSFAADVDDWFFPADVWDVETNELVPEGLRLEANDAASVAQQLAALRSEFAGVLSDDFRWTLAFNGSGADLPLPATIDCGAPVSQHTLSTITRCLAGEFWWVNHTWSHEYMDRNYGPGEYDISYEEILEQVLLNDAIVDTFGFGPTFSPLSLVTGDISGLGWFSPGWPDTGPKVDFGLEASNPDLLQAVVDTGRRYLASNMSTPSHEPDCWACGVAHPLNPSVFLVPRWPTNLYVSVNTPAAVVDAYNSFYGPNGSDPYFDHDLSYEEYLDVESDIAITHLLSGSPYPHYFHIANLDEYAPGRSVLYDWTRELLAKYSSLVDVPLVTLPWDEIGDYVERRTSFAGAGAFGRWNKTAATVTVGAENGGTVFLTGASLGGAATDVTYGGQLISEREFGAGETVTFGYGAPQVPTQHEVTVTVVGEGTVTGAGSYQDGATATLTATPAVGWAFAGWSGSVTSTDNPLTLTVTSDVAVTATFAPATRVLNVAMPETWGTVISSPEGIDCPRVCWSPFPQGSTVTLTATPHEGKRFVGWSGDVTSTDATVQVVMDTDPFVTATFADKLSQTITFDQPADRSTTAAPFSVTATASSGLPVVFTASGVCTVAGNVVTLTGEVGACSLTASQPGDDTYEPAEPVTRTFQVTDATTTLRVRVTGQGTVSADLPALASCADDCQAEVALGTTVTLTATPASGWSFAAWSGAASGTGAEVTVTVSGATTVEATFVQRQAQTITFGSLRDKVTTDPSFVVSAQASSGMPVTFTASGVCTVSGDRVTLTGQPGTCSVTASQEGDGAFLPASPVTRSFQVVQRTRTLNVTVIGDGRVTGAQGAVDCSGVCRALIAEHTTAALRATPANGWRFVRWYGVTSASGTDAHAQTNVDRNVIAQFEMMRKQWIVFPPLPDRSASEGSFTVAAQASSGLPVTFTATGVCTVAGSRVTLTGQAGTCTITAQQAGTTVYMPAQPVSQTFRVTAPARTASAK